VSKFTEQLREIRVFNDYEFAGHGNVYISYVAADRGRGGHGAKWKVHRAGFRTDPKAPWYEYGDKAFNVWGGRARAEVLAEAQAWAGAKYGIKEWARTPFGSYMDAAFVTRRMAELKALIKQGGKGANAGN
jgi:hypothetical protein